MTRAIIGLVFVLICGACGAIQPTADAPESASATPSTNGSGTDSTIEASDTSAPVNEPNPACNDQIVREPDLCFNVDVDGTTYRYGFASAGFLEDSGRTPAGQAVIVDPGGPGASVLAGGGLSAIASSYLLGGLSDFDLVVIEEPWVTTEVSDQCATSMTEFYHTFRPPFPESRVPNARNVSENCKLLTTKWGLSEDTYSDILDAIESEQNTKIRGFVGASFGSVRWTYADPQRFDFAVFSRPFPININDSHSFLSARSDAIASETADAPALTLSGVAPAGRSLPVETSDVVAARIAAAAQGLSPSTEAEIGEWSDGLWQRFGEDSISPALLAYWQEFCPRIGAVGYATNEDGIHGGWAGDPADVYAYLQAFHQVCDFVSDPHAQQYPSLQNVCAVLSQADTVTPAQLAHYDFKFSGASIVVSNEANHRSLDGLNECVNQLSLTATPSNSGTPTSHQRPDVTLDGAAQGWSLISESSCAADFASIPGYERFWDWQALVGSGPIDSTPIVSVTKAQANSYLAVLAYQTSQDEFINPDQLEPPLNQGWLTGLQPPNFKLAAAPDGSLVAVAGVPASAAQAWTPSADPSLRNLESDCWSQRWQRRTSDIELSDVQILYGEYAMLKLLADRADGIKLLANDQHPNIFTYENGSDRVALIDLRPETIIVVVGFVDQPIPNADELARMIPG